MDPKLKVACIGAGAAGTSHMVRMEKNLPGCCVAFSDLNRAAFDRNVAGYLGSGGDTSRGGDLKSSSFALRPEFRNLPYYQDPEEMLRKEKPDVVIIASYCSHHAAAVEICTRHGVNIVLEKPIAITEPDVRKVWALLRNYPKVATVNLSLRGSPVSESARRHIQNGDIGRIVSVQFVNNVHYGDNYFRGWMRTHKHVGSLLLQKATHDLDLINYFIGLIPESVAAFGSRQVYGGNKPNDLTCDACDEKRTCFMSIYRRKVDASKPFPPPGKRLCVFAKEIDINDNEVLAIRYQGGVTASYSQTFNAPHHGGQRGGYFIGTEGILDFRYYGDFEEHPDTGAYVKGTSTIKITRFNDRPGSSLTEVHDWANVGHFGSSEHLGEGLIKLLQGGQSPINAPIRDGYISAMMCLAADRSINTGNVVKLDLDL
ncbi:MAG: Gfo/Idh/MocA family oxidoreductase [Kiritimatiellae bacterium]|nr:Gfo/Idh/MocA family oxidoreductase [Kiritimatiellia bacterium]